MSEKYIEDFPLLELSQAMGKVAILCESEDEFLNIVAAMKIQYPERCDSWNFPECKSGFHDYDRTCICIDYDDVMVYGDEDGFIEEKYEIIPFHFLQINPEEISISDENQEEFSAEILSLIC